MNTENIVAMWEEFKDIVGSIDTDLEKAVLGNKTACVRARKGLRASKKVAHELTKLLVEYSHALAESKKVDKQPPKKAPKKK